MTEFGKRLRRLRQRCHDPGSPHGKLTQEKFGELVGREFRISYSGAAISDWERGVSKIHTDQWPILLSLIKVLHQYGGIKTPLEANQLLEAGNYRALDSNEKKEVFGEIPEEVGVEQSIPEQRTSRSFIPILLQALFSMSEDELQALITKADEGPRPSWPRLMVAIFRRYTDHLTASRWWVFILWVWVWLSAWILIFPSLRWPFSSGDKALLAVVAYAAGSILIPVLIGALTNTRENEFWQKQQSVRELNLRLYTHQGANIGFHVGYFFIFMIGLLRYNLSLQAVIWLELAAAAFLIILGYASARLVPYNLLLAYKQLRLKDGAIFFVFFLLGPAWGYFLMKNYDILLTKALGIFIVLSAITILLAMMALRYRQTGTTVIPAYWWLILYGALVLCQFLALLIK